MYEQSLQESSTQGVAELPTPVRKPENETPLRGGELSARVYDAILERLMSGQLPPGSMLDRRSVAAEMGMSVAPVLEAMLQLQAEGFLEAIPRRGTRVRLAGRDVVRGQLILREALECTAARLVCGETVRAAYGALLPLAEALDGCAANRAETWKAEADFHGELVKLAGCPALEEAFSRVMRLSLFFATYALTPLPAERAAGAVALLNVLREDDAHAAEEAMRACLRAGREGMFERAN
jgi:GntR family transcriptional regulator, rspAB operon transcriptional repressor